MIREGSSEDELLRRSQLLRSRGLCDCELGWVELSELRGAIESGSNALRAAGLLPCSKKGPGGEF
jgi:hypothetical protein